MTETKASLLTHPALEKAQLQHWLAACAEPAMRARQVQRWIFSGRAESFEEMTDLPQSLRDALTQEFSLFSTRIDRQLCSSDGTTKLLLRLSDEHLIECVLLHEGDRHTACISTQVGCGMGCVFCASGLNGVERNLSADEIVEQLVRLRNLLPKEQRLTHVVVMGMGEPLANLEALMEALQVATTPSEGISHGEQQRFGLGLSARNVTISTVGLPARMRQLADLKKQYHLAVSLHAPDDRLRNEIVPANDKVGLDEILSAADYFYAQTHRQVTYEYVLLGDVNDQPYHADQLARLLRGRQAHVNLIPFNDVTDLPFQSPRASAVSEFVAGLRRRGIVTHVRKRKGADIDAACGQLRRSALTESSGPNAAAGGGLLQIGHRNLTRP